MQSPSLEWCLAFGYLGALDYLRSRGDADSDTLSEVCRDAIYRHRRGKAVGTAAYGLGAVLLYRHIFRD